MRPDEARSGQIRPDEGRWRQITPDHPDEARWSLLASSGVIWFGGVGFPEKSGGKFAVKIYYVSTLVGAILGPRLTRDPFGGLRVKSENRSETIWGY